MKGSKATYADLEERIRVLEAALRVARGTTHSILHGDQKRDCNCQDSPCGGITMALLKPIKRVRADEKEVVDGDGQFTGSIDEDAIEGPNNRDWDPSDEVWASSAAMYTRRTLDRHPFWESVALACEHVGDGETKSFHLKRQARGQAMNRMALREKLMSFVRANGGADMKWRLDSDDDGGYHVRLGRGKIAGYAPVPDQGYYFAPNHVGSRTRLRHPGERGGDDRERE